MPTPKKKSDSPLTGKKIKTQSAPAPETSIANPKDFMMTLVDAAQNGKVDMATIGNFDIRSQSREQLYEYIDTMAQDDIISSVIDVYTDDIVETNDKGQVMWCESSDANVAQYVTYLLDSLNVDKHLRGWAKSLLTYGDLYLRLYKESDYGEDPIFNSSINKTKVINEKLDKAKNENINLKVYGENDHYVTYVEAMSNPGEVFELTKFGKTVGYIYAPTRVIQQTTDNLFTYLTNYKMKKKDVEVYDASSFVHACLEDATARQPDTVDLFLEDPKDPTKEISAGYKVRRGQSMLYDSFRVWRELNLLENSAMLNRLTKSAVVRILNVDIGDMPKEQVTSFMSRLKEKIEQRTAFDTGKGMQEYTNPGPIENTIYIPTHGTQGQITSTVIGGDYDPKSIIDIEYFRDKLFGALRVPKQFFGFTEDGAGFNGGESLTILDARYGKTIKQYQNLLCQMITDLINLYLLDRDLGSYINKFTIRMQTPVTRAELDRRANNDTRMRYVSDVMSQLQDVDDKLVKLKVLKSLLGDVVNDPEVMSYIQDYISGLEAEKEENPEESEESSESPESEPGFDLGGGEEPMPEMPEQEPGGAFQDEAPEEPANESVEAPEEEKGDTVIVEEGTEEKAEDDSYIPSPAELGLDLTDSNK